MLRRIGNQKPKNFGTKDLTQGYHQAPITINTGAYTTFILFCGVNHFTRLPFGPERAPTYFQQVKATAAVLIYFGRESDFYGKKVEIRICTEMEIKTEKTKNKMKTQNSNSKRSIKTVVRLRHNGVRVCFYS